MIHRRFAFWLATRIIRSIGGFTMVDIIATRERKIGTNTFLTQSYGGKHEVSTFMQHSEHVINAARHCTAIVEIHVLTEMQEEE
jgi:hypothetical protein